jgi:DDE superfamily endonuclease
VRRWLAETYPAIRAQARREGGVVLWLDEMGVRSDAAAGRSWAPVGQTPVIKRTGKRFRVNMISAISNAGLLRFRLFVGSFSSQVFIDFLRRLLRDCGGQKVHLIVDGLRCTGPSWSAPGWRGMPTASSCTSCPATAQS